MTQMDADKKEGLRAGVEEYFKEKENEDASFEREGLGFLA